MSRRRPETRTALAPASPADGKPEAIKTFRPNGTLAIVERDPQERGYIDIVEYYDASGKLIRREERKE